jgi:lipopolysaccharide/colanic/teichoic acid biosynthesis glycosyltransferase
METANTINQLQPTLKQSLITMLFKRAFDVCCAIFGLVILSPFFLVIATLIKRESPGPVTYHGSRVGKDGGLFQIIKFRTMVEHPQSYDGPPVTAEDDGRVTSFGRWLRDTKLNELPQLWNVLRGDMSIVGPRPEDPEIAKTWPAGLREEILSVRPGITSPASIIYRDEEKLLKSANVMDDYLQKILPDKLRLDRLYVRNCSFISDLDIIFMTFTVLLPQLRRDPIPTEKFYNGALFRFVQRYFSWFIVDLLVSFIAISIAGLVWRLSEPLNLGFEEAFEIAICIALVFSCFNALLGLEKVWWRRARPAYALDIAISSVISTVLLALADWYWPKGAFLPLNMLLISGLLAFLGFVAVRYRERLLTGLASRWFAYRGKGTGIGERVLIVGAGECGLLSAWLIQKSNLSSAFSIIGMVDDDASMEGMTIDGHRVFGLTRLIPELVQKKDIGVILFAIEKIQADEQERILGLCRQTKARLVLIPDLLAILRERLSAPSANEPQME